MDYKQALEVISNNLTKKINSLELSLLDDLIKQIKIEDLKNVLIEILSQKWINYSSIKETISKYKKEQLESIEDSANKYLNELYGKLIRCFNFYENRGFFTNEDIEIDIAKLKINGFKNKDGSYLFDKKELEVLKGAYESLKDTFGAKPPFRMFYELHNIYGNNILSNKLKDVIQDKIKEKHYQNLLPKKEHQKVLNLIQGKNK